MLVVCSRCCDIMYFVVLVFVFKQKTAYEMRISDWSSDVCSSDLMARSNPFGSIVNRPVGKGAIYLLDSMQRNNMVALRRRRSFRRVRSLGESGVWSG